MCLYLNKMKLDGNNVRYVGDLYLPKYKLFPCGKCYECVNAMVSDRAIRWREQLKMSEPNSTYFITLTYRPEDLPVNELGHTSLDYSDVAGFLKRLRRRQEYYLKKQNYSSEEIASIMSNVKVQYTGEYGSQKGRPHYHLIITNLVLPIDNMLSLKNNTLVDIWQKGHVQIQQVAEQGAGVIKYIMKYCYKDKFETSKDKLAVTPIRYDDKKLNQFEELLDVAGVPPELYTDHDPNLVEELIKVYKEHLDKAHSLVLTGTDLENLLVFTYNAHLVEFARRNGKARGSKFKRKLDALIEKEIEDLSIYYTCWVRNQLGDKNRYYLKGKNKGRIIQKSITSLGVGENYLTMDRIAKHIANLDTNYKDIDIVNGVVKPLTKRLPKYYVLKIFNPTLKGEEKEQFYKDYANYHRLEYSEVKEYFKNISVRKYREDMPHTFKDSPYYKLRRKSFTQQIDSSPLLLEYMLSGKDNLLDEYLYNSEHSAEREIRKASYQRKYEQTMATYDSRIKARGLQDVI